MENSKKKKSVETGKGNLIPRRLSKKVEADTDKLVHKRMSSQAVFLKFFFFKKKKQNNTSIFNFLFFF